MKIRNKTRFYAVCAMCTAVLSLCSWISIPTSPPFTLQNLAVFVITGVFGTSVSISSYLTYCFIGILGVPVFSGFSGGIAAITGPTGGYIFGFVVSILAIGALIRFFGRGSAALCAAFSVGLLVIYTFGTLFFAFVWLDGTGIEAVIGALASCVFPFVPIDIIKLGLAVAVTKRLEGRFRI